MAVLNELREYLYERGIKQIKPVSAGKPIQLAGKTKVDSSDIKAFDSGMRDCKEYASLDGAVEVVFNALRNTDLFPITPDNKEWFGALADDIDVGEVATVQVPLTKDRKIVGNAILSIDLIKNSRGDYEVSAHIDAK